MLKTERQKEIINIMKEKNGFVTVKDLCSILYSSESSIRRDLSSLENQGIIQRSYGGARLKNEIHSIINFNNRTHHNKEAKTKIAKKAASLISEENVIFLDQSSTSFYLANELYNMKSLTIVTNNIEIISLMSQTDNHVVSSGGFLCRQNRNCLIGNDAHTVFHNMYADYVFFSAKGVSPEGIITDCEREEILVRDAMIKNAKNKVFLCDSEKIGTTSVYKQCSLDDIDIFVCENEQNLIYKNMFSNLRIM